MRRFRKVAAVAAVTAAMFSGAACSKTSSDDGASETEDCVEVTTDIKVGMAFDVGGRGDQSFNDSAAAGLLRASCDLGLDVKTAEAADGEPEAAREDRLQQLVDAGYDPIIAVGFAYSTSLGKVAKANPGVHFAIVDDVDVQAKNIANLVFADEQGSFLVGAAAALTSESDNLGFIGGVEVPLIQKFEAGYTAGAKAVNPDVTVQSRYLAQPPGLSGFDDPKAGRRVAKQMYDKGADVVYHAAGGSGGGLFEAAAAADTWAIGVDADQATMVEEALAKHVLTSMVKNTDVAVFDYLSAIKDGSPLAGAQVYDLASGGVGYSTTGGNIDGITQQLDEYQEKIISGEITVPSQ